MLKIEIEKRLKCLQEKLFSQKLDCILVFTSLNIFYFTSLWIKGFLKVTPQDIILYVKRPFSQLENSFPFRLEKLENFRNLPEILTKDRVKKIGLELRALSIKEGEKLKRLLEGFEITGIDELIWELRMIKSDWEIRALKRASKQLSKALREVLPMLRIDMREIEASALLEKALRCLGHPGYTRSANGYTLTYGYLISGKEGLYAIPFETGEGGKGVEGFPGGASFKKFKLGEPILIDFSGFAKGYYVDQTRMASFGVVKKAEPFFQTSLEILKTLEKLVKPGIPSSELYYLAEEKVEKRGLKEYFMKHGEKLPFLGHGVGLEIDEPPIVSPKGKTIIQENMVIALEPKFHVPDIGVIGLEDTFHVTNKGLKRLTNFPREWIILGKG